MMFFYLNHQIFMSIDRWNQHYRLLHVLYIQLMKKSLQMHAGRFHIYLMAPMIKSKLWLRLVCAQD